MPQGLKTPVVRTSLESILKLSDNCLKLDSTTQKKRHTPRLVSSGLATSEENLLCPSSAHLISRFVSPCPNFAVTSGGIVHEVNLRTDELNSFLSQRRHLTTVLDVLRHVE